MQGTNHGATITTDKPHRKVYRAGREFYLAARGALIARDSNLSRWSEERGYTRQQVEDSLYAKTNSPLAKTIRAALATDLSLDFEES